MKVLLVSSMFPPYRWGGVSAHVHDLAVGLCARGHDVWILSNRRGKQVVSGESEHAPNGAHVLFSNNLLQMFLTFWRVAHQEHFDLVHFHSFNTLPVAWAGFTNGAARVFTMHSDTANYFAAMHGWSTVHPAYVLLRIYERFAIRFPDITIAVTRRVERIARELGADGVVYLPNAVDCDYWTPGEAQPRLEPSILVPRRLLPIYGVEYAIRSMKPILAAVPRARMVIAGDGPLREPLMQLASQIAPNRIQFLGEVPRSAMRRLYREASLVMIPSVPSSGAQEGSSMATIEAMSCARPVVATNIGGLPELIQNGATGILVRDRDLQALASAAVRLLKDQELARRLGTTARQTVLDRFSVRGWTNRVLEVYAAALGGSAAGPSPA